MSDDTNNANENKDQPVTISAPPAAAVTIDPQNPLPEGSFFWRRVFAAVIALNALVFAWYAAGWFYHGQQWEHLYGLTKMMIFGAGLILTYYFVAPSAAELTNMLATAGIMKHSLTAAVETAAKTGSQSAPDASGARFGASPAPDSQIRGSVSGEASSGLSGDVGNSTDIDVAPRGRS